MPSMHEHTTDTVYQIALVIKDLRNRKAQNEFDVRNSEIDVISETYFAIFTVNKERNYYVQICPENGKTILAELSAIHSDMYKLGKSKDLYLERLGWKAPQSSGANFSKYYDVSDESACHTAAAELVLSMVKAFDYRTNEPLEIKIDKWEYSAIPFELIKPIRKVKMVTRAILLTLAEMLAK